MQVSESNPLENQPHQDQPSPSPDPDKQPAPRELHLPERPANLEEIATPESPVLHTALPLSRDLGDSLKKGAERIASSSELRTLQSKNPLARVTAERAEDLGFTPSRYAGESFYRESFKEQSLQNLAEAIPAKGLDLETIKYLELEQVWKNLSKSAGLFGSIAIAQNALQLNTSEQVIAAKQETYRELLSDTKLATDLLSLHENLVTGWEGPIADFLVQGWNFSHSWYSDFARMREALRGIIKTTETMQQASSPYMQMLVEDVLMLKESETFRLVTEGILRTDEGLRPKSEVSFGEIASKFRPWVASPSVVALTSAALSATVASVPHAFDSFANFGITAASAIGTYAAFYGTAMFNSVVNQRTVAEPLKQIAATDETFHRAIEALGRLGELSSGVQYIENAVVPLRFPQVIEAPHHFFRAKQMRSPLFNQNPAYVPSDVEITDQGITFVTGPNSGGKTTVARALLLNQIQAQMGLPLPVEEAQIGIADTVAYQVPEFNEQDDSEGRFGVELGRTRDIVFHSGSRTFNILDELAEGTTAQEKAVYSRAILDSLTIKGSTTILITHDLELTKLYKKLGIGNYLQVEFKDGNPTHRLVEGISTSSHADRVARRIGFSIDDIKEDLRQGGYLQ